MSVDSRETMATKGDFRSLLGLMLSVLFVVDSVRAVEELKCELITVSACQNLVYNMTVASAPIATTNGSGNSTGSGESNGEPGAIRSQLDAELLVSGFPFPRTACRVNFGTRGKSYQ